MPKKLTAIRFPEATLKEIGDIAKSLPEMDTAKVVRLLVERGLSQYRTGASLVQEVAPAHSGPRFLDIEEAKAEARELGPRLVEMQKDFRGTLEPRESGTGHEITMPELGYVAAGPRGLVPYEFARKIQVPQHWKKAGARYVLRVRGDSMIDMGIVEGDVLFVKPAAKAEDGDKVIAMLNGNAMVKILRRRGGKLLLESKNTGDGYSPVEVTETDELLIQGIVVGRSGNL